MINNRIPFEQWQPRLEAALGVGQSIRRRVAVLRETDSTQDSARELNLQPGDVAVAWRQARGRGRLGRAWQDTGEDGVAMTLVVHADRPERLAIAGAVATAMAIECSCHASDVRVAIKWPNDILMNGRKAAGVLIEQSGGRAFMGIGVNVHQSHWPDELRDRAVSLTQAGVKVDRLQVMIDLIAMVSRALTMNDESLSQRFLERDCLCGTTATFQTAQGVRTGTIRQIDPMQGFAVCLPGRGDVWLPAATTTVLDWHGRQKEGTHEIRQLQ